MELRMGLERHRLRGRGLVAHAVPARDRTRSAVCGSSVRVPAGVGPTWTADTPGACPDCLALLRLRATA